MTGNSKGKGRVAVVTGAAGGLGAAYASRLAADGFAVAIVDVKAADSVVAAIAESGGTARAFHCDITDAAAVQALAAHVEADLGPCAVLVNNAGIYEFSPHETLDMVQWRRMMSLNLDAMMLVTSAFIPAMKRQGWGRIINIASNSCFIPPAGLSAYVASKSASIGYVRALAGELGQYGITVNAVAPGPTVTDTLRAGFAALGEEAFQASMQQFVEAQAVKDVAVPAFSAPVVAFFASDEAAFVTGQTLVVDGGMAKH
jgi:NAD(P)-dependent dehydrogenase (short-subunit alcohol dehydrogenase family)